MSYSSGRPRTGSSIDEFAGAFYNPPFNNGSSRHAQRQSLNLDDLGSLTRRNTTSMQTSSNVLSPIGQLRRQATDQSVADLTLSGQRDLSLFEKKQAEYEFIRQKKAAFQAQMEALAREEARLKFDLGGYSTSDRSEPTTPPEHHDSNGFPTALSKPNRFSSSSIISPSNYSTNRSSRAGSFITTPPVSERDRAYQALTGYPSQSVPGSRRDSDEEDDRYDDEVLNFDHRKAASLNRNSMPVTRRDARNGIADLSAVLESVNTTSFLFDDDMKKFDDPESTPTARTFPTVLQMHTTDDKFPILVRQGQQQDLTASRDALDLAMPSTDADTNSGGWPTFARKVGSSTTQSPQDSSLPPPGSSGSSTPSKTTNLNRHSMGARIGTYSESKRPGLSTTSSSAATKTGSSFSTSSVPTMNSINTSNGASSRSSMSFTAEQRLHNHNVSLGRIPASAAHSNRHSRDFSLESTRAEEQAANLQSLSSTLQANALPFGPTPSAAFSPEPQPAAPATNTTGFTAANLPINGTQFPYSGYNVQANLQALTAAMNTMQLQAQPQVTQQQQPQYGNVSLYSQPFINYSPYGQYGAGRVPDSQSRVVQQQQQQQQQQRRPQTAEDGSRFLNIELDRLQGEIYGLCKDQHGCRYLQKKLEERKPENVELIFRETNEHMVELMIDPFGNYLCQKLLESTNEEQRTTLIHNAAPDMVNIALNQHGTRALQKMIEYVSTPVQVEKVIHALQHSVVQMIQDLNGNHVIQKCLNRLSNIDAQFIFDAVAGNCVTVGTHRHGCCVIQRCIDHASGHQKAQLVAAITSCSMELVQDPFGNYVLQYIFDLGEESFSQPLCETFLGSISRLSKQKFSSNVMEKCLRIASSDIKHRMIQEIIASPDFERLVDDPFANYVIQTAWDYAETEDEALLADKIRPCLPRMRHKPYGRRFQTKVAERDKKLGITHSGTITPSEMSSPESSNFSTPYQRNAATDNQNMQAFGNGFNNFSSPPYSYQSPTYQSPTYTAQFGNGQPHRVSNPPYPNLAQFQQGPVQQPYLPYGRPQQNGTSFY